MKLKYPNKLKDGMKCVDMLSGIVCYVFKNEPNSKSPLCVYDDNKIFLNTCTEDGMEINTHKFPRYLTLENAEALGIIEKPPVVIKFDSQIDFERNTFGNTGCIRSFDLANYKDKKCHCVITIKDKE